MADTLMERAMRAAANILDGPAAGAGFPASRDVVLRCMSMAWVDGWSSGGTDASEMVARYISELAGEPGRQAG